MHLHSTKTSAASRCRTTGSHSSGPFWSRLPSRSRLPHDLTAAANIFQSAPFTRVGGVCGSSLPYTPGINAQPSHSSRSSPSSPRTFSLLSSLSGGPGSPASGSVTGPHSLRCVGCRSREEICHSVSLHPRPASGWPHSSWGAA